jgi:hypothetical protein
MGIEFVLFRTDFNNVSRIYFNKGNNKIDDMLNILDELKYSKRKQLWYLAKTRNNYKSFYLEIMLILQNYSSIHSIKLNDKKKPLEDNIIIKLNKIRRKKIKEECVYFGNRIKY